MNEVTIYQQIADPVTAIKTLGGAIARSQIFGCQNEAQGEVLAMECLARKLPPLMLAERYDIIQGKLSMKADAMLAGFEEAGGEYEVKEYSPEACEITFRRGKSAITLRISWEEAQKESWPYGKGKELKHNWASPIGRQDMLWARVVSRGVRRLAPGVVCGRYTPEEISDIEPSSAPVTAVKAGQVKAAEPVAIPEPQDMVEDAEFVVEAEQDAPPQHSAATSEPCLPTQVDTIKDAIKVAVQTGIPDMAKRVKAKLTDAGLETLSDLTMAEADQLLRVIQIKSLDHLLELSLVGHKRPL